MDANSDTEIVGLEATKKPSPKINPPKTKIRNRMPKVKQTNTDKTEDVSSRIESDNVQGQMYFWDISEDPNVVIRQSHLEEFLLSVLSNTSGVSISFYQQLVGYLSPHLSDRFKKSVVNNMEKVGDIYLLKIPHKE